MQIMKVILSYFNLKKKYEIIGKCRKYISAAAVKRTKSADPVEISKLQAKAQ